jgi:octopine/nopaline transport system substrate-binding protein
MTPGQTGVKEVDALKEAFKGKTIGIQAATVYAKFVYDNFGDIADIREYKTGADRDLDLQSGRIDLGFDDAVYFANAFQSANDTLHLPAPKSSARSGVRAKALVFARPIPICGTNSTRPSNRRSPTAP